MRAYPASRLTFSLAVCERTQTPRIHGGADGFHQALLNDELRRAQCAGRLGPFLDDLRPAALPVVQSAESGEEGAWTEPC